MENANKEFLSLGEVGAKLGVSRETARRFVVKERNIPHVRHGRSYRIPLAVWEQWLASERLKAIANVNGGSRVD